MNHNPRKFEEKIALNKQKQAEQDKQFEDIIRDVNNIRDNESNHHQFQSLPNINGPPPGMYAQYTGFGFNIPISHQENMWNTDIHHGLNLQLPETHQGRRVLSDSQLHKPGMRVDMEGWNNHQLQRPKSASELVSYENSIVPKTGSLPDLSQNYIPVQDESYNQNILHQHYQDSRTDGMVMPGPSQYQMSAPAGPYYMSLDEATATELQHRARQFSPTPSPPATPQQSLYNYSFGSPNQSYQRMTAQMQEVHLHNVNSPNQVLHHSSNGSPIPHSGQASPELCDVKPYIDENANQQYIYFRNPPRQMPANNEYTNPAAIPKIQVYTPEEALSPQYYPPDDDMNDAGDINEFMLDYDNPMMDNNFDTDDVQGTLENMFTAGPSYQNYPYS